MSFPPLATRENRTLTISVVLMALSILNKVTSSSSDYLFFNPKSMSCYKFFFIGLIWQTFFVKRNLNKMLQSLIQDSIWTR